jgi:predicted phage tail protein
MTTVNYETDIIAWANQQAWLIRHKKFDLLDIEHIAEEIEDVGKSEQRELANRMTVLIAHLLKWQFQPERRGKNWEFTIRNQRKAIQIHLKQVPSLKTKLNDAEWWEVIWGDAVYEAAKETGLDAFPETQIWSVDNILSDSWLPD